MSDSVKQLRELEANRQAVAEQCTLREMVDFNEEAQDFDFAAIAAELEALRTENAKLRSDLDHMASDAGRDSCAALAKENAELRARVEVADIRFTE